MKSLEESRKALEDELAELRGAELVRKLAHIIALQSQKIEALSAAVKLLDAYEENREVLLGVSEPVFAATREMATSYEVLASEHLPHSEGFHAVEFDKNGLPFRWSGAEGQLQFSCYVDRKAGAVAELELFSSIDPRNLEEFEVYDGAEKLEAKVAPAAHGQLVRVNLPAAASVGMPTDLLFRFPHFRKLSDQDERVAAVAFHRLAIVASQEPGGDAA